MLFSMYFRIWILSASFHKVGWAIQSTPLDSSHGSKTIEINNAGGHNSSLQRPVEGVKTRQFTRSEVTSSHEQRSVAVPAGAILEKAVTNASRHKSHGRAGFLPMLNAVVGKKKTPAKYLIWTPYSNEVASLSGMLDHLTEGTGVVAEVAGGAVGMAAKAIDEAAAIANHLADKSNPNNKFCAKLNEDLQPAQIEIHRCDEVKDDKQAFWKFPEPGTVGPITLQSDHDKCIGVNKEWWGSSDGKFTPQNLELTKCSLHVSEQNHSFIMPRPEMEMSTGMIAWATHPDMCIDIADHPVAETEINGDKVQDAESELDKNGKVAAVEHMREFNGNSLVLAKCLGRANWTTLHSLLPGPLGSMIVDNKS